jgi:hypothetical protein
VELAGWENIHYAITNEQGEYRIADVPPGLHMIIPQTNVGLTSYQSVNVVAGEESIVDFSILQAYPYTVANSIKATIYEDGNPVENAYLWLANTNEVYVSNQDGQVNFVYASSQGKPIIVVHNDRWTIQKKPSGSLEWQIELSRASNPPPLPENMEIMENAPEEEYVGIYEIIPVETEPLEVIPLEVQPLEIPFFPLAILGSLIQEDCISFEGGLAIVEYIQGSWKIVVGNIWLLDFGDNQQEAIQSLNIIQYYGFNQQCFVGRPNPPMEYFLVNGQSPSGPFSGENCIGFNLDAMKTDDSKGWWRLSDGSTSLFYFGDQEAQAQNALQIINRHQFTHFCWVGENLAYFRQ